MSETPSTAARPYRTPALGVASFLLMYGLHPRVIATSPTHGVFEFSSSPELDRRLAEYWAGKAIVNLNAYEAARNLLRAQLRAVLGEGGAA